MGSVPEASGLILNPLFSGVFWNVQDYQLEDIDRIEVISGPGGTLWGANIIYTTAMLNALAFVAMFVIGGLSGIFMAATPVDVFIHDTYFIVAHLHYVLIGGALFPLFGAFAYWYPKAVGRRMSEGWGKVSFWLIVGGFNLCFFPMHILGLMGMPRRVRFPWIVRLGAVSPLASRS